MNHRPYRRLAGLAAALTATIALIIGVAAPAGALIWNGPPSDPYGNCEFGLTQVLGQSVQDDVMGINGCTYRAGAWCTRSSDLAVRFNGWTTSGSVGGGYSFSSFWVGTCLPNEYISDQCIQMLYPWGALTWCSTINYWYWA